VYNFILPARIGRFDQFIGQYSAQANGRSCPSAQLMQNIGISPNHHFPNAKELGHGDAEAIRPRKGRQTITLVQSGFRALLICTAKCKEWDPRNNRNWIRKALDKAFEGSFDLDGF